MHRTSPSSPASVDPWDQLAHTFAAPVPPTPAEVSGLLESLVAELDTTPLPLSEARIRALWHYLACGTAILAESVRASSGEGPEQITVLKLQRATAHLARHAARALRAEGSSS